MAMSVLPSSTASMLTATSGALVSNATIFKFACGAATVNQSVGHDKAPD